LLNAIDPSKRIVITGIGTINPIGNTVSEFWHNLVEGKSGVRRAKNMDVSQLPVKIAAEIDLPDLKSIPSKRNFKRLDRSIILAYIAGSEAITDSGLDIDRHPERYGALIGCGGGGIGTHWKQMSLVYHQGWEKISPYYVTNVIPNSPTAFLSLEKNIQGPSFSVNSACASSNHAIGLSAMMIKMGMADAMFAGGTEAVLTPATLAAFDKILAISRRNEEPETASRPFEKNRDGFVLGEGAAVLCIEEMNHALHRDAHIYGEISGFGFTSDAYDIVAPQPDGSGPERAIRLALSSAQLNPSDIDLINCQGTSSRIGDIAECKAINRVFGSDLAGIVHAQATKSLTGHLMGASEAVEAIACLLTLKKNIIHRTLNLYNKDPSINLNIAKETVENANVNHILSNAFGFGGHNAVVVLSKYQAG
jgi:3-oxoacyl-[acyl-carrier-protein] synthase II